MSSLSTHVLDAVTGDPAVDVAVRLERRGGRPPGPWTPVADARTDGDGRVRDLTPAGLEPGVHRLVFDTAGYFAGSGQRGFYPEVVICFEVTTERHYHVPLLLSPYAFSTYRGS
ncbi:hydroxyisourate hydrolase [Geodermatophilus sp. TF02-6]|uniref:hydroxyisourate hydrolase n=1 Tax=Geodermatophilus sp. TF02-6 TaxID=2250575 RepID=UPI000DEB277E|nr:hydroxyisourate hydrolase [Geodermatophilus sp. TF02-6]RBY76820.1 hydroxyisourate hydrolase [Geodermatophilus sp. TF02-6]